MEACFANLVERGDKVIVCINGVFGARMRENALRMGAQVVVVEETWGRAVDPNKVEEALKNHKIDIQNYEDLFSLNPYSANLTRQIQCYR